MGDPDGGDQEEEGEGEEEFGSGGDGGPRLVYSQRVSETDMLMTKRKPVSVGEMLLGQFLEPLGINQTKLAEKTGLPRKHVNELCRGRRAVTADTALILARVFGNSADFWLNTQRRTDLWEALNTPKRWTRILRPKPIGTQGMAVSA